MMQIITDEDMMSRIRKNNRMKRIIGFLLLTAIAYFIFTNFDLGDFPKAGFVIHGESNTCTEVRGPQVMTDTEIESLQIEDKGFQVLRNENKAVITVRNTDDTAGSVKVRLYCINGNEQGDIAKNLDPGETAVFSFLDIADCDLDYIILPDTIKRKVNKTVYVSDSGCE